MATNATVTNGVGLSEQLATTKRQCIPDLREIASVIAELYKAVTDNGELHTDLVALSDSF